MVLTMIRSIDFDSWYWFWIMVLLNQTHTRGPSVARMRNLYQYKPHYHPQGHVSAWCKEHCNPRNVPELNSVNTVICEQVKFSISLPSLEIQGLETNVSHQSFWFIQKTVNLDLWLKTNFFFLILFLIMFHDFRFGLCIFSINLTYRCVKCLFNMIN